MLITFFPIKINSEIDQYVFGPDDSSVASTTTTTTINVTDNSGIIALINSTGITKIDEVDEEEELEPDVENGCEKIDSSSESEYDDEDDDLRPNLRLPLNRKSTDGRINSSPLPTGASCSSGNNSPSKIKYYSCSSPTKNNGYMNSLD